MWRIKLTVDCPGEDEGDASKLPDVPKRRGVKRPQPKLDSQRSASLWAHSVLLLFKPQFL